MAEIKISALDLAPQTPTGTEVFAVVQGSTTHKTTIDSLKPALVDNLSTGAPTWDVNGNLTAGYDIIAGGNHTGKVALTINDGYGNANLTFNHTDGIPDVNGSSGRISCAVDSNQEVMDFQLKGSVTAETPVTLCWYEPFNVLSKFWYPFICLPFDLLRSTNIQHMFYLQIAHRYIEYKT